MLYSSLISGILLVFAGLIVWYFKFTFGMGKGPGQKVDKKGLSAFVGKCLIIAGAAIGVVDNAIYLIFQQYYFYISLGIIFVLSFYMTSGMQKFVTGGASPGQKADPKKLARKQAAGKTPEALKHKKQAVKRK